MSGVVNHNILENLYASKVRWYWSLKPGRYIDANSGKDPHPDMVIPPWRGTLPEWNKSLVSTICALARSTFDELSDEDILFLPNTIYSKFTPDMLSAWHGKVFVKDILPFDVALIKSKNGTLGNVKVLNISEKGNLI